MYFRKTQEEISIEIESRRPKSITRLSRDITISYCWGNEKKTETFSFLEPLKWVLSYQNPLCMRSIKNKYSNIISIRGLGSNIEVKTI